MESRTPVPQVRVQAPDRRSQELAPLCQLLIRRCVGKAEERNNLVAVMQGVPEGWIVIDTQRAAEPDQNAAIWTVRTHVLLTPIHQTQGDIHETVTGP